MYILDTKEYFFLELNPRLQVEHPVSESITGVSMPGTQLHVAMGIPLYNIPEVRLRRARTLHPSPGPDSDPNPCPRTHTPRTHTPRARTLNPALHQVRVFYDQDKSSIGEIDLDYFKPNSAYPRHCIAARITAENPDEGFKPTSGKIERIVFQSNQKARRAAAAPRRPSAAAAPLPPPLCRRPPTRSCVPRTTAAEGALSPALSPAREPARRLRSQVWGYFSVIADGGVHEYADSQFGHIFANAPTREEARRALVGALKELFILGEIRTTVEYLGELLETDAFKENTIDTAWLDGIIAEKSVSVAIDTESAVINAAVFRGWKTIQVTTAPNPHPTPHPLTPTPPSPPHP